MVKPKTSYIAALDIGTTKIACFIAELETNGQLNIIGIGHQESQGIKSGIITNIQKAEHAIRTAVSAAEQMAGINIDKVIVNISGAKQISHTVHVEVPISHGQEITERDIHRLTESACARYRNDTQDIIHCIPLDFSIDNNPGIIDPKGMFGTKLAANLHIITGCTTTILNVTNCLAHCHLDVDYYISTPYASGYACLNEDEKELGCVLIEFGSGNTTISSFRHGHITHLETISIGGIHITNDIALGISTHIDSAERIKSLYGCLFNASNHSHDTIEVPQIGESGNAEVNHIPRNALIEIIKPRVEEILEMVKFSMEKAGLYNSVRSVVITGGASQLSGMKEFVGNYLHKQVRIGIPFKMEGITESTSGPAFSTIVGMLQYYAQRLLSDSPDYNTQPSGIQGTFSTVVKWFKDNF
jgi:cell division protein FtsA